MSQQEPEVFVPTPAQVAISEYVIANASPEFRIFKGRSRPSDPQKTLDSMTKLMERMGKRNDI
jgi:hypothetical protein